MSLSTFQRSAFFLTYSQHAWLGALLTLFALLHLPWWLVLVGGPALAAAKEFLFDHYVQDPPESFASGWTGVKGYLMGVGLGFFAWSL
jgi:hypothetical protein